MGGGTFEEDWELTMSSDSVSTLVLVGRTGNGKSATGNSILGEKKFISKKSLSSITTTCELAQTILDNGQIINVIDTPGLSDSSVAPDFIVKEIAKCITLSKGVIHAVLVVVSLRNRFSMEEMAAYQSLCSLFGDKIVNYMIVVLTGGDELEEDDETPVDYLGDDCPQALKGLIRLCNNRVVLFDNKAKNESKKASQVGQLLSLVESIAMENGRQPYTDEMFYRLKERGVQIESPKSSEEYPREEHFFLKQEIEKHYKEKQDQMIEMESKLKDTISLLESKVAQEESLWKQAELFARHAQNHSNQWTRTLRESLEAARHGTEHLRSQAEQFSRDAQKHSFEWTWKLRESLEAAWQETEHLRSQAEKTCTIL